jgi:hypothetical protein
VDIPKALLPRGIFLMTSADAFLLGSFYLLKDSRTTFVPDNISLNIGFGIAETIADQFIHFS